MGMNADDKGGMRHLTIFGGGKLQSTPSADNQRYATGWNLNILKRCVLLTADLMKAITVNALMIDWYLLCNSFNNALPRVVISKLYGKRLQNVSHDRALCVCV